jgi:hypothetical protein
MALQNYNFINISDIQMKSYGLSYSSGNSAIVTESLAANRILIMQSLVITNYDFENTNAAQVDVYVQNYYDQNDNNYLSRLHICKGVIIPHKTSFVALNESTPIYLRYNDSTFSQGLVVEFINPGTGQIHVTSTWKRITV